MATAVASKPAPPHQTKMKRPPLPTVQTNGIQSSQSLPSPSMSSKRLPSGFKAPPALTANGATAGVNGIQSRASQRRKDSQKPGDSTRTRNGKEVDRRLTKRKLEPYVKTSGYILKKYRGHQPSLIIHLHQTNFRFEQQHGSFSYTSPMKFVLEHLKKQTVPHQMIEELLAYGVKFFENCLVVQVKDHRGKDGAKSSSQSDANDSNMPSSVHNYQQWVTPSPYVPFPEHRADVDDKPAADPDAQSVLSEKQKQKEREKAHEPRTYTVVLFPTSLSMQEEAYAQANTPDSRPGNRKTQSTTVPRTPASASATVPPTPLSTIPFSTSTSGPAAKKQKMSISGAEIHAFESKIVTATASPLFLDTVSNLEEAHKLLESLTDPLHKENYPSPKTRKRTIAELAADEAIAAQEQAFMLIMDEKAGSALTAKITANDETATASFEPRFERFNAIQQIQAQAQERRHALSVQKQRQDIEAKRQEEASKASRAQKQIQERMEKERQASILAQRQAAHQVEVQRQKEQQMRQQQLAREKAMAAGQPNGGMPNGYGQPQHSSPIIRNGTPHSNASPVVGNMMVTQAGGVPMQATSSGQGSSPGRPPSSMQHAHPAPGGIAMVHQRSRQQIPSRTGTPQTNGTPHMPSATPNIPHSTPVVSHANPTSRMHGSPPNGGPTPAMTPGAMPNPISQEQQQLLTQNSSSMQAFLNQQTQRQQLLQHQRRLQQNGQLTPNGNHMAGMQQLTPQQRAQQEAVMRQQMNMNSLHGHPNMPNNAPSHGPPQQHGGPNHPSQQQGQSRPMNPNLQPNAQAFWMTKQDEYIQNSYQVIGMQMMQRFGVSNVNQLTDQQKSELQSLASHRAGQLLQNFKTKMQQSQQQHRQDAQIQANMHMLHQGGQQPSGGGGAPNGMAMANMGMAGNPSQMGMGGGQQFTREQMMQMAQMQRQQQQQMNGQGMNGMGQMNGVNGMNGMG